MNGQFKTSSFPTATTVALTTLLVIAGLFLGSQPASAGVCSTDTTTLCVTNDDCPAGQTCLPGVCSDDPTEPCDFDTITCSTGLCELAALEDGCMQDVAGFGLNCTANDVRIASVFNVEITDGFCIDAATLEETTDPCTDDSECAAGQFCGFGCASPSDTVTLSFDMEVLLTAQDRHDIGIYFSLDSGDALTGECRIETLPFQGSFSGVNDHCTGFEEPFICCDGFQSGTCDGDYADLDNPLPLSGTCSGRPTLLCDPTGALCSTSATPCESDGDCPVSEACDLVADECSGQCDQNGPDAGTCFNARGVACIDDDDCNFGLCEPGAVLDTCGDISDTVGSNPLFDTVQQVTLQCDDSDGDGFLDVAVCTSWRQPGADELCTSPFDAFPGSPAKCRCDEAVTIPVFVPKSLEVQKVAIPVLRCADADTACTVDDDCPAGDTCEFGLRDAGNFDLFIDPPNDQFPVSDCVTRCNDIDADACVDDDDCSEGVTCEPSANCTSGPQDVSDGFCSVSTTTPCTTNDECPDGEVCDPTDRDVGETFNETDTFSFLYTSGIECRDDGGLGVVVASCGPCTEVPVVIPQAETDIVCVVTNATIAPQAGAPRLTLVKEVVNDDGGTAVESDWTLSAAGATPISGAGPTVSEVVAAGDYTLSESGGPAGYTAGDWTCEDALANPVDVTDDVITLANGDDVTCTIVNDDDPPTLKLVKMVTNDNGGTAVADNWTLSATAPAPDDARNFSNAGGSGVFETVFAGADYTLAETSVPGYSVETGWVCVGGTQAGNQITVGLGESATCTIVNTDNPPSLTLVKEVNNNNGGTAVATAWTLSAAGPTPISGAGGATSDATFSAGTYTLSETSVPDYSVETDWVCVGGTQAGNQITVGLGESATCTIVNTDDPPSLTLVKEVNNDNGGTAVATAWTLSAAGPTPISGAGGATSDATFSAGTYTLSETSVPDYSVETDWVCVGGTQAGNQITVGLGESATCTIVNTDNPPSLTLVKEVNNDNGGTAVATAWTLSAAGPTPISGAGGATSDATFSAGTYTLSETSVPDYSVETDWVCVGGTQAGNQITVGLGESATCTIVNTDNPPSLTLVKEVNNDNGGTAVATAWTLSAAGPTPISGAGGATSDATFSAGTYTLSETSVPDYSVETDWVCVGGTQAGNQITVGLGESATCTIVNTDNPPSLTLVKEVNNNNGGTAVATAWTLSAAGPTPISGAGGATSDATFSAGTYTLSETSVPDYSVETDWVCVGGTQAGNQITVGLGESATCTIVNTDNPPSLTLVKEVNNDNGGTAVATAWTLSAAGPTPISGAGGATSDATFSAGTYTLSETSVPDYSVETDWVCVGGTQAGNQITVGLGESATCTIVNTDDPPSLTLVKEVNNDNGGTAVATAWTLSAAGPTPISGAGGATSDATFSAGTYTLSETSVPDYSVETDWVCVGGTQAGNQITVGLGESATCTIVNTDDPPSLTLVKEVNNNNGGTAVATAWTLSAAGPTPISGAGGATSDATFSAGTYTLSETSVPDYSVETDWVCVGGTQAGNQITVGLGESATCTIVNTDDPPSLTLVKEVNNNNGGTAVATAWTLSAAGPTPISGAGGATSDATFSAGTYTLSETSVPDYSVETDWVCVGGTQAGNQITVGLGESATCTIVNTDDPPSLTLVKEVNNNNGGTAVATAWTLSAAGPTPISGAGGATSDATFSAGTYTLSETSVPDYSVETDWVCVGGTQAGNQITVGLGESATCTIVNTDNPPSLTLVKEVNNNNGGTAVATAWTLSAAGPTPISGAGGATSDATFSAGTYTLSETSVPDYSVETDWVCVGGTQAGNQITVGLGESATCTIVNTDDPPSLTLVKEVNNDNGGTAVATAWTLSAAGPTPISGAGGATSDATFSAGTYTLSETSVPDYSVETDWVCVGGTQAGNQITVGLGESATCTIVNTDNPPSLTLVKEVNNDNGGTAVATAWTLSAAGPTPISGAGGATSDATFSAGTYTLSETSVPDYSVETDWVCVGGTQAGNQITVGLGESATCTIVNTDNPPSLTLVKEVNNNNGGTAVATAWTLSAAGPTPISGAGGATSDATFSAGTYTLSETSVPDYSVETDWVCVGGTQAGNQITVGLGESATCTIVNTDNPPSLTLVKEVNNDNGGTAVATAWTLSAAGPTPISGAGGATSDATFSAGTYTLSETSVPDYSVETDWVCVGGTQAGNQITVGLGESATCTIVNTDDPPSLTLVKEVNNNNGGTAVATAWTLSAAGPTPISGAGGATSDATFSAGTYTLSETSVPGYSVETDWVCVGGTQAGNQITVGLGESATCTIVNGDIAPRLKIIKVLQPVGDDGRFDLTITELGSTRTIQTVANCDDDPLTTECETDFEPVTAGVEQTVGENGTVDFNGSTDLNDYVITIGGDCASDGTITLGLAQDATCIITNVRKGMVELTKLTNGLPNDTMTWNFTLTGPGVDVGDSSPPSVVDFDGVKLIPGETYTLCETGIPMGWTLEWLGDPNYCPDTGVAPDGSTCIPGELLRDGNPDSIIPIVAGTNTDSPDEGLGYSNVFDPKYVPFPGVYTNDTRCVTFFVEPGETEVFQIDNQFPGGEPRTIGFWKNWNTCTGGNQYLAAAENGGPAAGWYILDDLLNDPGYTIGVLVLGGGDCLAAVDILDKRDIINGKKMANDAAYGLAAQLLAALLNLSGGAETCQEAVDAVNDAQNLLASIHFDGDGKYLRPARGNGNGGNGALYNEANDLAYTLDTYNNGNLCTP